MISILANMGAVLMAVNADSWKQTLPVLAIGMIGIFLVIGVVILITYGLNKMSTGKKNKKDKGDKE